MEFCDLQEMCILHFHNNVKAKLNSSFDKSSSRNTNNRSGHSSNRTNSEHFRSRFKPKTDRLQSFVQHGGSQDTKPFRTDCSCPGRNKTKPEHIQSCKNFAEFRRLVFVLICFYSFFAGVGWQIWKLIKPNSYFPIFPLRGGLFSLVRVPLALSIAGIRFFRKALLEGRSKQALSNVRRCWPCVSLHWCRRAWPPAWKLSHFSVSYAAPGLPLKGKSSTR